MTRPFIPISSRSVYQLPREYDELVRQVWSVRGCTMRQREDAALALAWDLSQPKFNVLMDTIRHGSEDQLAHVLQQLLLFGPDGDGSVAVYAHA